MITFPESDDYIYWLHVDGPDGRAVVLGRYDNRTETVTLVDDACTPYCLEGNCPFFVVATFIPNWCKRGAKIVNAYRTPDDCPLRKGDITVKLSSTTMPDNKQ